MRKDMHNKWEKVERNKQKLHQEKVESNKQKLYREKVERNKQKIMRSQLIQAFAEDEKRRKMSRLFKK
jgi:hypothetical protein